MEGQNLGPIYKKKTEKGKTGNRAVCKIKCKKEVQGFVKKLKYHYEKCKVSTLHLNTEVAGPSHQESVGVCMLHFHINNDLPILSHKKKHSFNLFFIIIYFYYFLFCGSL